MLFVLFYTLKQQSIHHRMKHLMEEQQLHTITVTDNEIQWIKEGKEIWVHGKMFDIKFSEHKNGMTTFHGLYDDEETVLKKNFSEGWKKNMSEQNHLLAQFFQSLQAMYFEHIAEIETLSPKQQYIVSLFPSRLLSQFEVIPTPPPQH